MIVLLVVVRILLSLIFLLAAISKFSSPKEFTAALRLSRVPGGLIRLLSIAVPLCELMLAVGLVLSPSSLLPWAMAAAAGLLALFTLWMLWVYARKLHLKCSCLRTAAMSAFV